AGPAIKRVNDRDHGGFSTAFQPRVLNANGEHSLVSGELEDAGKAQDICGTALCVEREKRFGARERFGIAELGHRAARHTADVLPEWRVHSPSKARDRCWIPKELLITHTTTVTHAIKMHN